MGRNLVLAIAIVLFLNTCDERSPQTSSLSTTITSMEGIDLQSVDHYPIFENCKHLNGENLRFECFGNTLVEQLELLIKLPEAQVPDQFKDTILLELAVDRDYRIKVLQVYKDSHWQQTLPEIDSLLEAGIKQLPSVGFPAVKMGVPVKSQFQLPVILTVAD